MDHGLIPATSWHCNGAKITVDPDGNYIAELKERGIRVSGRNWQEAYARVELAARRADEQAALAYRTAMELPLHLTILVAGWLSRQFDELVRPRLRLRLRRRRG